MQRSMITGAFALPGHTVTKDLGIVRGITVRSRSIVGNFFGGLQSLVGGKLTIYNRTLEPVLATDRNRPAVALACAAGYFVRSQRAQTFRVAMFVLAGMLCSPAGADATNSRDIVLAERSGHSDAPQFHRRDKSLSIEICVDTCSYFVARQMRSEGEVWDVVFLHQAFFDAVSAAKAFRAKHVAHVSAVLAAYAHNCSNYPQDASRAACIVKYLARRNGINYAFVRYERGDRCELAGELLVPSSGTGKAKCAPVKSSP
jgi:hypothetical protein